MTTKTAYSVWDRTTRIFHWLNVLCVFTLGGLGLAILNANAFDVSIEGKVLLKTIHVYIGYLFVVNLGWRVLWGFFGGYHSHWKRLLPLGSDYVLSLRAYLRNFTNGSSSNYIGHNPLAKLMVMFLFLLLLTQAITGLVLAGTDLYKPPFGGAIAQWVTGGDIDKIALLKPGSKDNVDIEAYAKMRELRSPVVTTHLYGFYVLIVAVLVHIVSVVVTEIREKNSLVSAMITGQKMLSTEPVDSLEEKSIND